MRPGNRAGETSAYADYSWITDRLAIGGLISAPCDLPFDAVLSTEIFAPLRLRDWVCSGEIEYCWCPVVEEVWAAGNEEIVQRFDEAAALLDRWLGEGKRVLVHCGSGISRSVTAVVQYLVRYRGYRWEDALELVRARRDVANPDVRFEIPLRLASREELSQEWIERRVAAWCADTARRFGAAHTPDGIMADLRAQGTIPAPPLRPA